jgi:hypothetical protein
MSFAITKLILVLEGLDCMSELRLVLAHCIDGRYNEVVLGWGIGNRVSDNSPKMNDIMTLLGMEKYNYLVLEITQSPLSLSLFGQCRIY